jgi:hypothetical protein
MRFTELERSLLAVNAALVARLDLIEQGDDFADTIAKRSCASCERALIEAQSCHAEEVNGLTDEVIGVKLERDQLFELITEVAVADDSEWPVEAYDLPGYKVWQRLCREKETLRFTPEDRVVPAESGVKATEPKPLQLEVGKKYRRRDGGIVTIEWNIPGDRYEFKAYSGAYMADGRWSRGRGTHEYDLIEEVTEEAAEVAA